MKKILHRYPLLAILFLFPIFALAQHDDAIEKHHIGAKGKNMHMPKFDRKSLMREDSINEQYKDVGLRFAQQFIVNLSPDNAGDLLTKANGSKLWTIGIKSDSAYSINLIFSKFHLLEGDTLYICNKYGYRAVGPLTQKNNLVSGILPTVPVDGDSVLIEFHQSAVQSSLRALEIGSVNHDYRGFRALPFGLYQTADTCSVHAGCATDVSIIKQSVCELILNGNTYCTGTLINNTAQDKKPYVLTAGHCFGENIAYSVADGIAPSIIAFFNYEAPSCKPEVRGSIEFSIAGSTLRAFATDIDFALVELSSLPPVDYRPYIAGWNRATAPPSPFTGIHHPWGTVKRVIRENNSLETASYTAASYMLSDSHWKVNKWEVGTTEHGSSGSPLFDANMHFVGALTGGASTCSSPYNDFYYRLNKAWSYYSDTTKQLKAWLDPTNTGVTALNGFNPYGNDTTLRISNISSSETTEKAYLTSGTGFLAGQNSLQATEYAEQFSLNQNAYLYGVYIVPAKANANVGGASPNKITIRIYNQGNDNLPSEILNFTEIDLNSQQWSSSRGFFADDKVVLTGNDNYVKFTSPVAVGKKFFVSYDVPYTNLPTDSFTVFTASSRAEGGAQTAFVKKDNSWMSMFDFAGVRTSLWIDPVIRYDSAALGADTALVDKTTNTIIFPNPTKDVIYVMTRTDMQGYCDINIYDFLGNKVLKQRGKVLATPISVDVRDLNSGVYLIQVTYSGKTETQKLIISK